MSERRAFLDRIRARQGPPPADGPHPPPPPPEIVPVMRYRNLDTDEDLLAVFVAAARAADATVEVVAVDELEHALDGVLSAVPDGPYGPGDRFAVVSNEPEVAAIADVLARAGVNVEAYTPERAATADIALTSATHGIAATGSVVVDSRTAGSRAVSLLPRVHVCVLPADRIVADPSQVLRVPEPEGAPSCRVIVTGPSRTGDIEQRLTLGAHGPVALHIVVTT